MIFKSSYYKLPVHSLLSRDVLRFHGNALSDKLVILKCLVTEKGLREGNMSE